VSNFAGDRRFRFYRDLAKVTGSEIKPGYLLDRNHIQILLSRSAG
jgi:hypothetical protein